jgi:hypothetical protein
MPLYPLGISRSRDAVNAPQEFAGAVNVRWRCVGELACAYIDGPHGGVEPMLHASLLDAIHRRICVLPVRVGTVLNKESEIGDLLESHRVDLLGHLDSVDHACEMDVRVGRRKQQDGENAEAHGTISADGETPPPSPVAYIERRRRFYRQADAESERDRTIVQLLAKPLQDYCRQWRKLPPSPRHAVRMAFLVEQNGVEAFQRRIEEIRSSLDEPCLVLGPWPPYSFV